MLGLKSQGGLYVFEVEPCINGQIGAVGAYFGQDVRGMVDRLLAEQLPDGGWNCEEMPVETGEGEGRPSRWNTLRALRVLNWYSACNARSNALEHGRRDRASGVAQ
jgi:hypothetical protein